MKTSSILAGALRASLSILSLQLKTMKEMSAEESADNVKTQTLINNAFKSFVKELLKEEASRFGPDSKAYKKKVLNMRDQLMKGIAEHMTEVAGEMEEDEDKAMESDFTDDLDSEESDATANKGDDVTEMETEVESEDD
ncbi:hypothetical protein G7Y79_00024g054850 [Physcia stellaris]|nr:hypothetical protein G7Y79_00024g054850 [Physcia stellaris]